MKKTYEVEIKKLKEQDKSPLTKNLIKNIKKERDEAVEKVKEKLKAEKDEFLQKLKEEYDIQE